jgi:hypothetical protein
MSRILRRPMFRGGPASSDGVGITSGLDTPRKQYAEPNEDNNYNFVQQNDTYDPLVYNLETESQSDRLRRIREESDKKIIGYNQQVKEEGQQTTGNFGINPKTGLPWTQRDRLNIEPSIIDIAKAQGVDLTRGENNERLSARQQQDKTKLFKKQEDEKKAQELRDKALNNKSYTGSTEDITQNYKLPTIGEDIDTYSKLLMNNAGPDRDEYTRQKYLTLAKFGFNLLKSTPAGIKPSLLNSIATAAEKPLEEYGNISMQESKEGRASRQLAAQLAFQKHMPGNMAKGIQDLLAVNPKMTVEEATSIVTTGKNLATIKKEERISIAETRSRLETNPNLKGLAEKDPASLNLLAKLIDKGNIDDTQIKGDYGKYNKYVEDSYYTNVPNPTTGLKEVARYSKGKFYYRGEPGFFIKQTGI